MPGRPYARVPGGIIGVPHGKTATTKAPRDAVSIDGGQLLPKDAQRFGHPRRYAEPPQSRYDHLFRVVPPCAKHEIAFQVERAIGLGPAIRSAAAVRSSMARLRRSCTGSSSRHARYHRDQLAVTKAKRGAKWFVPDHDLLQCIAEHADVKRTCDSQRRGDVVLAELLALDLIGEPESPFGPRCGGRAGRWCAYGVVVFRFGPAQSDGGRQLRDVGFSKSCE